MAKTTTITMTFDFALAEVIELHALKHGLSRQDAIRMALRQVLDPLGERRTPREPFPWVKVKDGEATVWIFDGGKGRWATARKRSYNAYPILSIEEPGWPVTKHELVYSPDDYALYIAESILLERWPDLRPPVRPVGRIVIDGWRGVFEEALKAA